MGLMTVAFIAIFVLVSSGGILLFYREGMRNRLAEVVAPEASPAGLLGRLGAKGPAASLEKLVQPFHRVLPRSVEEVSILQKRLIRAGYRKNAHVKIFYGSKVLVPLALAIVVTVTGLYDYSPMFVYAIALGLGFLAPDFWLGNRIKARQLDIRLGLPEVLDLMVICIEAGLSLDQAAMRTADELRLSQPAISDELAWVNLEQRAGRPRSEAWTHLAERTDVDTVRALVAMLIQADQFGSSITRALRVHSETLRTHRRQSAEEQAAKTTVKLVFPLVLFIFPSLFVVTLGPSMIIMFEAFSKYLSD